MPAAMHGTTPLQLPVAAGMVPLRGQLALFYDVDSSAQVTHLAALAGRAGDPFRPLPHDLALGHVRGTVWLRLTLVRPAAAPADWWLEVRRPTLDEVLLYRPDDRPDAEHGWQVERQGDHVPWAERPLRAPSPLFLLHLPPDQPQTLYLRLRSTGNMAAPLRLWQPPAFVEANGRRLALYGGFALTSLVIAVLTAFQGVLLRDLTHLIYAFYVLVIGGFILATEGVVPVLLQTSGVLHMEALISLLQPAIPAAMALLTRQLLPLARLSRRLDRTYLLGALAVLLVGTLAVPLGLDAPLKPLWWWCLLGQLLVNLVLALWLAWGGERDAWFYLAGFGVFSLAAGWSLLAALGLTGGRTWSNEITVFGSLVHMIMMQLAIADRVQRAKRAHDAARERALQAEQRATSRLDEAVAQRTTELQAALLALAATMAQQAATAAELAAAKARVERALAEQRQLTAMLSHELRNPLASIAAGAELLLLRRGDDSSVATLAGRIRRGAARAGVSGQLPDPRAHRRRPHRSRAPAGRSPTPAPDDHGGLGLGGARAPVSGPADPAAPTGCRPGPARGAAAQPAGKRAEVCPGTEPGGPGGDRRRPAPGAGGPRSGARHPARRTGAGV